MDRLLAKVFVASLVLCVTGGARGNMMRAVVYHGTPSQVIVTDVPMPTLQAETDAIVRITLAGICGTDLHMYHGLMGTNAPWVLGHEGVGYVVEAGRSVTALKVGDYVAIPDNVANGHLDMQTAAPNVFGVGRGLGGLQAEFARVPFAEESLIPLPINHSTRSLSQETAYITLSDILATGWQSLDHAGFTPGDSVAIFGAGPVGLLATLSARFRGASRVFLIDRVPSRLRTGASLGAIPIDFAKGDPVGQIRQYTPDGVQRAVDCVGMEAVDEQGRRDPSVVIHNMQRVVARGGGLGQVGVYEAQNNTLAAPLSSEISPDVAIDLSSWFQQGLSFRTGIVDPKALAPHLLSLLQQKRLDPNFLTTAVISIEDAPLYYRRSSNHEETKVFIRFPRGREKNE